MKANALKKKIADGVNCVGGLAAIPNAFAAEVYAAQGWDSVTIDMQHGASDINDVVPMLQAMSAGGSGSMCTMHVRRPHAIISRLVQLCTEAGMATEAAHHLIAAAVDVVVYISYDWDDVKYGGRKLRYVSHVYEVHDVVGEGGRPTTTELFAPHGPQEPRAVFKNMPSFIGELENKSRFPDLDGAPSFNRRWLTDNPMGAWGGPLLRKGPS